MQTRVTYSEALIRRAIFRWWIRFIGWHGFLASALAPIAFLRLAVYGTNPWIVYGGLAIWLFSVFVAVAVYVTYVRRSLSKFRRMNDPTAEITISNDELHMKSSLADTRLQWRVIEAIWRFPEAWLLFMGKNLFVTLPIDAISAEDRELMCAKVRENGGRVV